MAINWNEYELVLEEDSDKECEVTERRMGHTETFVCPIADLKRGQSPNWIPQGNYSSYAGYQTYRISFIKADKEGVHLMVSRSYSDEIILKPDEPDNMWRSGWYDFGSWSYLVTLKLRKTTDKENKSTDKQIKKTSKK